MRYDFTGKERDDETSYDYFPACRSGSAGRGARYYDSRIGRWGQVDTLFNKHYDFNPYNYALVNPMKYIDPDGKDPWEFLIKQVIKHYFKKAFKEDLNPGFGNEGEDKDFDKIPDDKDIYDNRIDMTEEEIKKKEEEIKKKEDEFKINTLPKLKKFSEDFEKGKFKFNKGDEILKEE